MHRLSIGVTAPVFELCDKKVLDLSEEDYRVLNAIKQHSIIISEKILEYYKAKLKFPEAVDSIIDSMGYRDILEFVVPDRESADGIDELLYCVSKCDQKILVGEKTDVKPYSTKGISLSQTTKIAKDKYTPISRFVFPVNYHVKPNCSCDSIADWFSVLFKGEKRIDIQDKYIMNPRGIKSLKKYYLPHVDKDAEINIYCTGSSGYGYYEIKQAAKDTFFDDYKIHIFYCDVMKHDRYIELSGIRIQIGAGLDLLCEEGSVREEQECDIEVVRIDRSQRLTIPKDTKKIR